MLIRFTVVINSQYIHISGLPRSCSDKESTCRRCKRPRFYPCIEKILWRRKWKPASVACSIVNPLTLRAGPITFYLCSVVKVQSHPVNKSGLISDSKLSLPFTASQAFGLKNLEQEGRHYFMAALLHLQIPDALGTEKARKIGRRGIGGRQTSPYLTGAWPLSAQS